jgi:hypothetical protein
MDATVAAPGLCDFAVRLPAFRRVKDHLTPACVHRNPHHAS